VVFYLRFRSVLFLIKTRTVSHYSRGSRSDPRSWMTTERASSTSEPAIGAEFQLPPLTCDLPRVSDAVPQGAPPLAYIPGLVNQRPLLQSEELMAEIESLRAHLQHG
jgi:hypothetical protein